MKRVEPNTIALHDNVVVTPYGGEKIGILYRPDTGDSTLNTRKCKVLKVGQGYFNNDKGEHSGMSIVPGDVVLTKNNIWFQADGIGRDSDLYISYHDILDVIGHVEPEKED